MKNLMNKQTKILLEIARIKSELLIQRVAIIGLLAIIIYIITQL